MRHKRLLSERQDGSWLADATMDYNDFKRAFNLENALSENTEAYRILGGFALSQMARVPNEGDRFEWDGFSIEVVDMDRHRIDKLLITRTTQPVVGGNGPAVEASFRH